MTLEGGYGNRLDQRLEVTAVCWQQSHPPLGAPLEPLDKQFIRCHIKRLRVAGDIPGFGVVRLRQETQSFGNTPRLALTARQMARGAGHKGPRSLRTSREGV
jgi:hypothetical protein